MSLCYGCGASWGAGHYPGCDGAVKATTDFDYGALARAQSIHEQIVRELDTPCNASPDYVIEDARSRLDAEILDHARTMRELEEAKRYSIDNASTSDLVWALVERAVRRVLR